MNDWTRIEVEIIIIKKNCHADMIEWWEHLTVLCLIYGTFYPSYNGGMYFTSSETTPVLNDNKSWFGHIPALF